MSWLFLHLASIASGVCPPATAAELTATMTAAQAAFAALDVPTFRVATAQLEMQLPCLSDPATRPLAAEVHRVLGLLAFANESSERAKAAFAAARAIEPDYQFSEVVVPADNPLRALYGAVVPAEARTAVPAPAAGWLLLDGAVADARPEELPVLFQHVDGEGAVTLTAYLWPDDPLPGYALLPSTASARPARPGRALLATALSSAVVAGSLYGTAAITNQRYRTSPLPLADREGLRTLNNGLVVASGAALAVAVGFGATAAAVGAR